MRRIKLQSVKNVRDLGGIETKYGKIRKGALLRGAVLDKLTTKDLEKLKEKYFFHTVIDLRTSREKEERPDRYSKSYKYIEIPIFDESVPGITHEEHPSGIVKSRMNMEDLYREVLTGEYLEKVGLAVRTIMSLEEDDYSVYFHCTAGKDRTGLIAAILLTILGVDRNVIIKDYLYTNKVSKKRAKFLYWKIRLFDKDIDKAEEVRDLVSAKESYIMAAFDEIFESWNGIDNFVKNGLKVTDEMIENFKRNVISSGIEDTI